MNAELVVQGQQSSQATTLVEKVYSQLGDPLPYAKELGEWIYLSGMFNGVKSPQAGSYIALQCRFEGITPEEYRRTYHLIEGRPSMRADAMLANFRTQYGGRHKKVEKSSNRAAIEFTYEGQVFVEEYTWEEAKASRWPWKKGGEELKDNWSTPEDRKRMLWARLVSETLRDLVPEMVSGMYTPEEMQDVVETPVVSSRVVSSVAEAPGTVELRMEARNFLQKRVRGLFQELRLSDEIRTAILQKRGCNQIEELSAEHCEGLIPRLEGKLSEINDSNLVRDLAFDQMNDLIFVSDSGEMPFDPVNDKNLLLQARVEELFKALNLSEDSRQKVLNKRACQSVSSLTTENCEEIIPRLEDKLKETEALSGN